jgi:hypothetical protein
MLPALRQIGQCEPPLENAASPPKTGPPFADTVSRSTGCRRRGDAANRIWIQTCRGNVAASEGAGMACPARYREIAG